MGRLTGANANLESILGVDGVPVILRAGVTVRIPCRHCGKALIPFKIAEGNHSVTCEKCGSSTEVRVAIEAGYEW